MSENKKANNASSIFTTSGLSTVFISLFELFLVGDVKSALIILSPIFSGLLVFLWQIFYAQTMCLPPGAYVTLKRLQKQAKHIESCLESAIQTKDKKYWNEQLLENQKAISNLYDVSK
ncbi:hypothetical protein [Catenovulum sediminis]|uniref:hypothetical protein n=1 Tax=Catenovulum sediminis TaxID=1740262 RepID=UPI00117F499F|nr:hypothetical protein [Catenovulum sediminis]